MPLLCAPFPENQVTGIDGLNAGDPGIHLLDEAMRGVVPAQILLVHCGDLPSLSAGAQRIVLDVRERAAAIATTIDASLGPIEVVGDVGHAIVWPRAHLGKDFTRWCLARAAQAIGEGGQVWCAVRKSKGADTIADAMRELVGPVQVSSRSKGYRLLQAQRRDDRSEAWGRELAQRYTISDEALLGDMRLVSAPGVFSRRALDQGTAALLRHVASIDLGSPAHVIDLCCGVGPLAMFAADRWPDARVTAVDSNLLAVALARDNVTTGGVSDRVEVIAADGLPPRSDRGEAAVALVNPPTHADRDTLQQLLAGLRDWLAPGSRAFFVVSRAGVVTRVLKDLGAEVRATQQERYTIVEATFGRRN